MLALLALLSCDNDPDGEAALDTGALDTAALESAASDTFGGDDVNPLDTGENGETAAPEPSIDADGDGFYADDPAETDCDDGDASVYPGAAELCDGVQNDCADVAWVSDAGLATFFPGAPEPGAADTGSSDTGAPDVDAHDAEDWTATLSGAWGAPAEVELDRDGTLALCEGTWYASLRVEDPVTLRIEGEAGRGAVALSGAGAATALKVKGGDVQVRDLTIRDGVDSEEFYFWSTRGIGGGLYCIGPASVTLERVDFTANYTSSLGAGMGGVDGCAVRMSEIAAFDNLAERSGGAFFLYGIELEMFDVSITDNISNRDSGGAFIYESAVDLEGLTVQRNQGPDDTGGINLGECEGEVRSSLFEDNEAGDAGGGLFINHHSQVSLYDVVLSGNYAKNGGGILLLNSSRLVMEDVGLFENGAFVTGGGVLYGSGNIEATNVDFDGNEPSQLEDSYGGLYDFGYGSDFTCDARGCVAL